MVLSLHSFCWFSCYPFRLPEVLVVARALWAAELVNEYFGEEQEDG